MPVIGFRIAASLAVVAVTGCSGAAYQSDSRPLAIARLAAADGSPAGTAEIRIAGKTLQLVIAATNVSPGPHGAHVHMIGQCNAPDFASAGGHLNPMGHGHGTQNPAGSHMGDLPNIVVSESGKAELAFALPGDASEWEARMFDADGSAVVIHAAADDYRTDPSGNSGARIACGVFTRPA